MCVVLVFVWFLCGVGGGEPFFLIFLEFRGEVVCARVTLRWVWMGAGAEVVYYPTYQPLGTVVFLVMVDSLVKETFFAVIIPTFEITPFGASGSRFVFMMRFLVFVERLLCHEDLGFES